LLIITKKLLATVSKENVISVVPEMKEILRIDMRYLYMG